jgi:hypothetical protein
MTAANNGRGGMRFVFWMWIVIIAGGLTIMITIPLLGR